MINLFMKYNPIHILCHFLSHKNEQCIFGKPKQTKNQVQP